tara:strand:+ start:4359 stop:7901 length:3543 start_codon:yes stop_codon:yes gene_type:complete
MIAQKKLEKYLEDFRQRIKALVMLRGAAVLSLVALVVTLTAVFIGTRQAFPSELISGARLFLIISLFAIAMILLVRPLRVLRRTRGVFEIEKRTSGIDGRLETYDQLLTQNKENPKKSSPFLGLLAEDALKVVERVPPSMRIPNWEISVPAVVGFIALGVLVWFASFGPDNWRYGVRHLWVGWVLEDTLPPQRIVVTPGDSAVRRGGDLFVDANAEGFNPTEAEVFALFEGSEDWESAPMNVSEDDDFEFTFFGVREPFRYYVISAGVHSAEYEIEVVDLPRVSSIKLTYHYPEWTELGSKVVNSGGDIKAVSGTQVEVEITTDQPLFDGAELVVNGKDISMITEGSIAKATVEVQEDGEYYVSTFFNSDSVRLSDDYFIDVVPDNKPAVKVMKPGRDWKASNIEEVSIRVEATDDFALDRLELHYAINGGEWNIVELEADGTYSLNEEVLYLEEIGKTVGADNLLDILVDDGVTEDPVTTNLAPGDLISYFAEAHDRDTSERTDLFFVEVQPFERSYSQSMQGGGGGGGGQQQQNEISQRQKEILLATWNLIREQEEQTGFQDEQQLQDNARMLAELQRTLADQARTLANRTRARQLTSVDDQIQLFVQSLENAAEAMIPAADRLTDLEFDNAVPSEQEALQHLLKAESVFTDIQVSFQQGGGGGPGGFAGRDLAELFELEMDLEKNQYETESPASFDTPEAEVDEAIAKLQELARRQENLARQSNNQQRGLTEEERWRQEELRRETEELRRQLEELRQAAAQPQSGQQRSDQRTTRGSATDEAIQQLDNALQAMDRAQDQNGIDQEQNQRAVEQARRQLDRALEQLTAQRQADAEQVFSDLTEQAESLLNNQRQLAAELQQVASEALANRDNDGVRESPLNYEETIELAERKWEMQADLEGLEEDLQRVSQRYRGQTPDASAQLNAALSDLQRNQVVRRLEYAAEMIRRGLADELAPFEGIVTNALDELRRNTEQALITASREARDGHQNQASPTSELVAELQALRRDLADLQNSTSDQLDNQIQANNQTSFGEQMNNGQLGGGDFNSARRGLSFWDTNQPLNSDPQKYDELQDRLQEAGRDLLVLGTRLRAEGLTTEQLEAVRELADALRSNLGRNPELLEQEYLSMLSLVEQLELRLTQDNYDLGRSSVRTETPVNISQEYEDAVAEYFRQLSRSE